MQKQNGGTWDELFANDRNGVSLEDSPETSTDLEKQLKNLLIREQIDGGRPKGLML